LSLKYLLLNDKSIKLERYRRPTNVEQRRSFPKIDDI
jgi:hypothetical protein